MEPIIKKAIEGGFRNRGDFYESIGSKDPVQAEIDFALTDYEAPVWQEYVCNPLFWQALGKACEWDKSERYWSMRQEGSITMLDAWENNAITFQHINLTEGWDAAVGYLGKTVRGSALVN